MGKQLAKGNLIEIFSYKGQTHTSKGETYPQLGEVVNVTNGSKGPMITVKKFGHPLRVYNVFRNFNISELEYQ